MKKQTKIILVVLAAIVLIGIIVGVVSLNKKNKETATKDSTSDTTTEASSEAEATTESTIVDNDGKEIEKAKEDKSGAVVIYKGNDNSDDLEKDVVVIESLDPQLIIDEMSKNGTLGENIKVNSFKNESGTIAIDVSSEFQDYIDNMGTSGELIAIDSFKNTFKDAYGVDNVVITVDGNALSSSGE